MIMNIPVYPDSELLTLHHKPYLQPLLKSLENGISEYTFANLYLFRNHYTYRISQYTTPSGYTIPILSGTNPGSASNAGGGGTGQQSAKKPESENFVMLPFGFPGLRLIETILAENCYIKNFPEQAAELHRIVLEQLGYRVEQDRSNFDYLYYRRDLASLNGKKFHKKRNLVNAYINNYNYEEKRIDPGLHIDALYSILEKWNSDRNQDAQGDFEAAYEAIEKFEELELRGCITYTDGKPSAYSMGEIIAHGTMFTIHFEKADDTYKGIYQFINRSFAAMLVDCIEVINREQDLGDPGLRQAKMSYRPTSFIKKYRISRSEFSPCAESISLMQEDDTD